MQKIQKNRIVYPYTHYLDSPIKIRCSKSLSAILCFNNFRSKMLLTYKNITLNIYFSSYLFNLVNFNDFFCFMSSERSKEKHKIKDALLKIYKTD